MQHAQHVHVHGHVLADTDRSDGMRRQSRDRMGHPAGTLTEHRRVGPRRTAHGPERHRAPYYRPAFPTPRLSARRQQSNDLQARPRQLHRRLAGCIDGTDRRPRARAVRRISCCRARPPSAGAAGLRRGRAGSRPRCSPGGTARAALAGSAPSEPTRRSHGCHRRAPCRP